MKTFYIYQVNFKKREKHWDFSKSPSLTETKSKGVCPSWFLRVGSAPWANNKAQSCVRPFWAASCKGVKAHLSVALTHALYFISKAATSTCCKRKYSCYSLKFYYTLVPKKKLVLYLFFHVFILSLEMKNYFSPTS